MAETTKNQTQNKQPTAWKVLLIFALAILLICDIVFIFNYSKVYDNSTDGAFLSPSFGVIVWHYLLAILFIFAALLLKVALKKRVRLWALLLASILVPMFCYHFNYRAFAKNGFLYPLVDQGGIFHFIVIGDYNLDGMNDERYHILYDERQYSLRYGGHFDDTIIDYIDTIATGTGSGLEGCFCFYEWEEKIINLYLNKDTVKLKQIEIIVVFQDPAMVHDVSFYLDGFKLDHTVNKYNMVSIVFDADACSDLQDRLSTGQRKIPIQYAVNE